MLKPMEEVVVAPLSDGRLQLWAIDGLGGVFSSRKVDVGSEADWTDFGEFLTESGPLPGAAAGLAVARLSDGRLQLWVTLANSRLLTTWQTQTDPNIAWTGWIDFLAKVGLLPASVAHVAVAPLSDGRLELWATTANGGLFTTWKNQADPNANWSGWSNFLTEVGSVPAGVSRATVARLQDKRLELWVTTVNGPVHDVENPNRSQRDMERVERLSR